MSELVRTGYQFDYVFDSPYVAATPKETEARHAGDCKAKSLWLAQAMNDRSIRFVIGKARAASEISHAWLMWKNQGRWWILDPTNASKPIPADRVSRGEYLVFYSYDQHGSTPTRRRPVSTVELPAATEGGACPRAALTNRVPAAPWRGARE